MKIPFFQKKTIEVSKKANQPTKEEVVNRALCLGAFWWRSQVEILNQMSKKNAPGLIKVNKQAVELLEQWLTKEHLQQHLSKKEKNLFGKSLDSWDNQERLNGTWRKESTGILLWALGFINKIPPYDIEFDKKIKDKLPLLKPTESFRKEAKLRSRQEITKARDSAQHWHWRSRTTQIMNDGIKPPNNLTFQEIIKASVELGYKEDWNPKPIDNDFPAFGKAYKDLKVEEYSIVTSIAMERHFALNWLMGYSSDWDEMSTPT
ncbi:DUF4272 domain-containing protein [Candidatus Microgenomates bacterium]|nr:DUF4272 domain-containing protein [Candidatus Microgenomates bacterium]